MTKAPARSFDLVGAVFAAAAVGLWLGTDAVAWALAGVLPDVGFPLLSVMVRGAMFLQLGNKSMLMSQKLGQRLADECQSPEQAKFAQDLKNKPPVDLLEANPAQSASSPKGGPN